MTAVGDVNGRAPGAPGVRGRVRALSVAPMMDRTDRHYRVFMRQITRHTLLYTEMITCNAILHGDRERLLGFSEVEHPLALQLGGDDPESLAACARIGRDRGYDEINLNVGCPSSRVQNGRFGACLMATPEVVARGVAAMRDAVDLPVTVKHRIGIDDIDRYEDMARFVDVVSRAGADRFSIHARKAWLQGLSPKENRNIPLLRYGEVHRLKREFPHLVIEINGGITNLEQVEEHLESVDAVMIGRAAYDNPWMFADVDQRFFGAPAERRTQAEVVEAMVGYVRQELARGQRLHQLTRHMIHLFANQRGARAWRRGLSNLSSRPGVGAEVLLEALQATGHQGAMPHESHPGRSPGDHTNGRAREPQSGRSGHRL